MELVNNKQETANIKLQIERVVLFHMWLLDNSFWLVKIHPLFLKRVKSCYTWINKVCTERSCINIITKPCDMTFKIERDKKPHV